MSPRDVAAAIGGWIARRRLDAVLREIKFAAGVSKWRIVLWLDDPRDDAVFRALVARLESA
jgi:hypothetical protein